MNRVKILSGACLVAALTGASALAQSVAPDQPIMGLPTTDAARVVHTVDTREVVALAGSHAAFLGKAKTSQKLDAAAPMNHLQLMLKRSAARQAASDQLSNDQHNPASPRFRQWLTPQEYGAAFGVADGDIAAVSAWLSAEGFTVNAVYPNRMQIDFSGTAGQVERAFHVSQIRYTFSSGATMVANDSDISVPAALQPVIAGVAGLSRLPSRTADGRSVSKPPLVHASLGGQVVGGDAIQPRLLVPNDLVTMYGMRNLRNNRVVGKESKVVVVTAAEADLTAWSSFTYLFNLARYYGTLTQTHPNGPSACNTGYPHVGNETALYVAEWITAMAPGADVVIASCTTTTADDYFSGVLAAATNVANTMPLPNVMDIDYSMSEALSSNADRLALVYLWEQADEEGISVFVPSGNYGTRQWDLTGAEPTLDVNALAAPTHATAVGGTDLADRLDGTTAEYFAANPSIVGGSALSYVPEIPWNGSCGNGVVAKHLGYNRVVGFCNASLRGDLAYSTLSAGGSNGGTSRFTNKPPYQTLVYNTPLDQSRDIPDVALFAGASDGLTDFYVCEVSANCNFNPGFHSGTYGTTISTAVFAGIQAVMDEGLATRGYKRSQGNAANTLYALAASEYGQQQAAPTLAGCNADNGATGTANCIFHNITRGSISDTCNELVGGTATANCFFYATVGGGLVPAYAEGLTTTDSQPTSYGVTNKAYGAQPGWSFASGLGSVNANNLLIAWRAYAKSNQTLP